MSLLIESTDSPGPSLDWSIRTKSDPFSWILPTFKMRQISCRITRSSLRAIIAIVAEEVIVGMGAVNCVRETQRIRSFWRRLNNLLLLASHNFSSLCQHHLVHSAILVRPSLDSFPGVNPSYIEIQLKDSDSSDKGAVTLLLVRIATIAA